MTDHDRTGRLVRGWTRVYTAGLSPMVAGQRREEIASDLAEHREARTDHGWTPGRVARERISRMVRGIPADLAWRRDVLSQHPQGTRVFVRGAVISLTTIASLLLVAYHAAFAAYLTGRTGLADERFLGGFEHYASEVDRPVASVIATVVFGIGLVMLVGAVVRPISPFFANVSTAFVAMPSLLFFWLGTTPVAAVVVLGAITDMILRAPELSTGQGAVRSARPTSSRVRRWPR